MSHICRHRPDGLIALNTRTELQGVDIVVVTCINRSPNKLTLSRHAKIQLVKLSKLGVFVANLTWTPCIYACMHKFEHTHVAKNALTRLALTCLRYYWAI